MNVREVYLKRTFSLWLHLFKSWSCQEGFALFLSLGAAFLAVLVAAIQPQPRGVPQMDVPKFDKSEVFSGTGDDTKYQLCVLRVVCVCGPLVISRCKDEPTD